MSGRNIDLALEKVKEILMRHVDEKYRQEYLIDEYLKFLREVINRWEKSPKEIKDRYAYNVAILLADSIKSNVVRAKVNSYYAYLVFRGFAKVGKLVKIDKVVPGVESIYTWLRMYRLIMNIQ